MRFGFVVFEGMTALDFGGMYDPITRLGTMGYLETAEWTVCSHSGTVRSKAGMRIEPDESVPDLGSFDVVLVPGGLGDGSILHDEDFLEWVATARAAPLCASVCTGSVILGAAGLIDGRRATTHPGSVDRLAEFCTVVDGRIVDDGDLVTASGVTASIDLGLYLVERLVNETVKREIALQMDYPYQPVDETIVTFPDTQ